MNKLVIIEVKEDKMLFKSGIIIIFFFALFLILRIIERYKNEAK